MPGKKISEAQRAIIAGLVTRGHFGLARIAKRYGITGGHAVSTTQKIGTFTPGVLRVSRYKKKKIIELYNSGLGAKEIGKRFGLRAAEVEALVHGTKVARAPRFPAEKEILEIKKLPEKERLGKYLGLIILQYRLLLVAGKQDEQSPEFRKRIERLSRQTSEIKFSFSESNREAVKKAAEILLESLK